MYEKNTFIDSIPDLQSSSIYQKKYNYLNTLDDSERTGRVLLEESIITKPYLQVLIPFGKELDFSLAEYDSIGFDTKEIQRGLSSRVFNLSWFPDQEQYDNYNSKLRFYLDGINEMFRVKIDAIHMQEHFIMSQNEKEDSYLKAVYSLKDFDEGKHLLNIRRLVNKADSTQLEHFETIPFWYFPD